MIESSVDINGDLSVVKMVNYDNARIGCGEA